MGEGNTESRLVVLKLCFGDGKLLSGGLRLGLVGAGQSLEGVHDGPRSL